MVQKIALGEHFLSPGLVDYWRPTMTEVPQPLTARLFKQLTDFGDLRLETMDKAGVISKPDFTYYHVIRFSGDASSKQFVVVNHKVKDFDAWLKVYDGEGPAKRASEGMVDIALARGIDDPNMVHIAFAVTDMAKAKAAIFSDDKKKLMMSAGVIGKPDIRFYNNTAK